MPKEFIIEETSDSERYYLLIVCGLSKIFRSGKTFVNFAIYQRKFTIKLKKHGRTDQHTDLPGTTVMTFKDLNTLSAFINDNLLNASINVKYLKNYLRNHIKI